MPLQLNPTPTQGTGTAFGKVPGALGLPDPFGDLSKVAPGLAGLNKNILGNLTSESLGVISPGTRNALQLAAAQRGVGGGMGPNSGLSTNDLFGNIAGFSEGLQNQALQGYNSLIPTISKTQTVDPALQTEISNVNALRRAAPSPQQQFNLAKSLYDEYAAKVRGPGGGISFSPQPFSPSPLLSAGGTAPTNYSGTGESPYVSKTGSSGASGLPAGVTDLEGFLGMGGVPSNTVSNTVTGTSNFDPFGGFGSFYAPQSGDALPGQGYGSSAPAEGTYMGANPDAGPAGGTSDLSNIGIDDALAQVFGL